jgi:hypothetical protein
MANQVSFLGYSRGSGRTPFLRVYEVSFSGSYAQDNAEVIDFNTALNPNGLEDAQVPSLSPSVPPLVLGSTIDGYVPELKIGGTGTAGEYGIRFWAGGAPPTELGAVAYSGVFPANGSNYGQVLIGILAAE